MKKREVLRLARQAQGLADALRALAEEDGPRDWTPVWRNVLRDIAEVSEKTGETTIAKEREILRRHLDNPRIGMRLFREGFLVRGADGPVQLSDPVRITEKGRRLLAEAEDER